MRYQAAIAKATQPLLFYSTYEYNGYDVSFALVTDSAGVNECADGVDADGH